MCVNIGVNGGGKVMRKHKLVKKAQVLSGKFLFKRKLTTIKKNIGKFKSSVSNCGCKPIYVNADVKVVNGDKGGVYYANMQRCGHVWFCPDCNYKISKHRANDLYSQLKVYRQQGLSVYFVTFTLQHYKRDQLARLLIVLQTAFNYANTNTGWGKIAKTHGFGFLRTLEVRYSLTNGWHPHLHCVFVVNNGSGDCLQTFTGLYKDYLLKQGFRVNDYTTDIVKWDNSIDKLKDYVFKGVLEKELTSSGLKKGKVKGSFNFFELMDCDDHHGVNTAVINEYITCMRGKRQFHHSKRFFVNCKQQKDSDIIRDDKIQTVLYVIPASVYQDIFSKGVALDLLAFLKYATKPDTIAFLIFHNVDFSWFDSS